MLTKAVDAIQHALEHAADDRAARRTLVASASLLVAAGAVVGVVTVLPARTPDYASAELDTIFDYTLLSEDFNKLPVQERVRLIGELTTRLRNMDTGESVLLAGFAAQIAGPARDQLVRNGSKLMADLTDDAAQRYDPGAPVREREAFLKQAAVDFMTAMETMTGEFANADDTPPEERFQQMQAQAQRDMAAGERGDFSAQDSGRIVAFVNTTIGRNTSAAQKARMSVFARDLTRVLRGQELSGP